MASQEILGEYVHRSRNVLSLLRHFEIKANKNHSNLGKEFVTFCVGKKRKEYIVHEKVICDTADYFSKALTGASKDVDGVIHLPEECPGAFGLFVDWLYRGTVPLVASQYHLERLFKLYVFAEKLCMEELANKTMDKIREMCGLYVDAETTPAMATHVFQNSFLDSPLRNWALEDLVFGLDPFNRSGIPDETLSGAVRKLCRDNDDFFEAYFRHIRATADGPSNPRANGRLCDFHRHEWNQLCYVATSNGPCSQIWSA